jgi:hypothetical protein
VETVLKGTKTLWNEHGDKRTVFAGTTSGLYVTRDGGASWQAIWTSGWVESVAIDAGDPDRMYAQHHSSFERSRNGGQTWESVNAGLPGGIYGVNAAVDPFFPDTIYSSVSAGWDPARDAYVCRLQERPELRVDVNQSIFRSGIPMSVTASVSPAPTPFTADVYIALGLPNGSLLFLQGDGSLVPWMTPIVSNWSVGSYNGQVFSYTFSGGEPTGAYTWYAAFAAPGSTNFIGPIYSAPFTFAP